MGGCEEKAHLPGPGRPVALPGRAHSCSSFMAAAFQPTFHAAQTYGGTTFVPGSSFSLSRDLLGATGPEPSGDLSLTK